MPLSTPTYSKKISWFLFNVIFFIPLSALYQLFLWMIGVFSIKLSQEYLSLNSEYLSIELRIFVKFGLSYFRSCPSQGWEICPYVRSVREPSIELFAGLPTKSRPTHPIHPQTFPTRVFGAGEPTPSSSGSGFAGKLRKLWKHNFSIQTFTTLLLCWLSSSTMLIVKDVFSYCSLYKIFPWMLVYVRKSTTIDVLEEPTLV